MHTQDLMHEHHAMYIIQYHQGRRTQQKQWVFGMVDTSEQPALGYMEVVQQT